jgi:RND family efflux transporter MFP subunit
MSQSSPQTSLWRRLIWRTLILAVALLAGYALVISGPTTQPEDSKRSPRKVQTISITPTDAPITITAFGTVIPARQVTLKPEIRGRVVRHHPSLVPGGYLQVTEELFGIDPSEYELALTEQQTALEEAAFEVEVERGRQVVASREWRLLQGELPESEANKSLVLREPHLRKTQAMLRKASNEIAKAQLNLSRTSVKAPFNAMVLDESVEIGELVEPGNTMATLVGTDEFWVRVVLPLDKLSHIQVPSPASPAGATAEIILDAGNGVEFSRTGRVVRLLSDLEPSSRMARLLISVQDPLSLKTSQAKMPLLIGSYVRVRIEAGMLRNVLAIQRIALREGNSIWVVGADNRLEIRPVQVLWVQGETVYLDNALKAGEQVIVSGLRVALPGMEVTPHSAAPKPIAPHMTHLESP